MSRKNRLLPDARGKIKEILLVSKKRLQSSQWRDTFVTKYSMFDSDVKVVLCSRHKPDPNQSNLLKEDIGQLEIEFDKSWREEFGKRLEAQEVAAFAEIAEKLREVGQESLGIQETKSKSSVELWDQIRVKYPLLKSTPGIEAAFTESVSHLGNEQATPAPQNGPMQPLKIWAPIEVDFCTMFEDFLKYHGIENCGNEQFLIQDWAQDPFLVMEGAGGDPIFIEPWYYSGMGNQYIADVVAEQLGYFVAPTRFQFEGGNVRVGTDDILVGEDTFEDNWKAYQKNKGEKSKSEFRHLLEQVIKTNLNLSEIHWLGLSKHLELNNQLLGAEKETLQPFFHLDIFLAYAGNILYDEKTQPVVFLAEITEDYMFWENDYLLNGGIADFSLMNPFVQGLNDIRSILKRKGFEVIRVPMGMAIEWKKSDDEQKKSDAKERKIQWDFHSYSNVVMEIYDIRLPLRASAKKSVVYVPEYSIEIGDYRNGKEVQDRINRDLTTAYKEVFSEIRRPTFQFSSSPRGALNCAMKVLRREQVHHLH